MICAVCGETLTDDGPVGWTHRDQSVIAEDGHAVTPVTQTYEQLPVDQDTYERTVEAEERE